MPAPFVAHDYLQTATDANRLGLSKALNLAFGRCIQTERHNTKKPRSMPPRYPTVCRRGARLWQIHTFTKWLNDCKNVPSATRWTGAISALTNSCFDLLKRLNFKFPWTFHNIDFVITHQVRDQKLQQKSTKSNCPIIKNETTLIKN